MIPRIKIERKLKSFLLKEGVYFKFKDYSIQRAIELKKEHRYITDINMAFTWAQTPEEHAFWSNLHEIFEKSRNNL